MAGGLAADGSWLQPHEIERLREDDLRYVAQTTPFGKRLIFVRSQGSLFLVT